MNDVNNAIDFRQPKIWEELAHLYEENRTPRLVGRCGRTICEPAWRWNVRLPDYDLWFVLRGSGQAWINGQHYPIQTGTLFLLRPQDQVHATHNPQDPLTVIYLHLDFFQPGQSGPTDMPGYWLPARHRVLSNTTTLDSLLTRCVRLYAQAPWLPLARQEANSILRQALFELYRQDAILQGHISAQPDPRLQLVIDAIQSNPARRLTLEDAAQIAGLSPKYLSASFTRQLGISLRAFLVQARLERAYYLLTETTLSVNEIAHMLGYDNTALFSRLFKQHYGYPPGQSRKHL